LPVAGGVVGVCDALGLGVSLGVAGALGVSDGVGVGSGVTVGVSLGVADGDGLAVDPSSASRLSIRSKRQSSYRFSFSVEFIGFT
jgi:hypothetical protein